MKRSVLIVMPDPELADLIGACIRAVFDAPGKEVDIHWAVSTAEARKKMADRGTAGYDLLVCHIHIPEDETTRDYTRKTYGLGLLQSLNSDRCRIPAILIAHDAGMFNKIQELDQVKLVIDGTETMEDELKRWCLKFLLRCSSPADPKPRLGRVDLILKAKSADSTYFMEGSGVEFGKTQGNLHIDTLEIDDLIHRSNKMLKTSEWKEELYWIGRKILREFFEKNMDFSDDFSRLAAAVGDEKQLWIRFVVEKEIYPLALEALVDKNDNHIMLLQPMFRTVTVSEPPGAGSPFLFGDPGKNRPPVNCLIIAADTCGEAEIPEGGTLILNPIPKVMAEADHLHTFLAKNKDRFGIEKLTIVTPHPDSDFSETLYAVLYESTWDLIHYAGHTCFDTRSGLGYFFFPSETGPKSEGIKLFSQKLRFHTKTQFIYLSSCESSGADFVLSLARQHIPSIIGFRWEIEDDKAAEYAGRFYQNLFEKNRPLPYAFLETRQEMYEKYCDNRIWAAAMLIIQDR